MQQSEKWRSGTLDWAPLITFWIFVLLEVFCFPAHAMKESAGPHVAAAYVRDLVKVVVLSDSQRVAEEISERLHAFGFRPIQVAKLQNVRQCSIGAQKGKFTVRCDPVDRRTPELRMEGLGSVEAVIDALARMLGIIPPEAPRGPRKDERSLPTRLVGTTTEWRAV